MLVKANITFDGQAEEAINFYQKVFKGEIVNLMRYGQVMDKFPAGMVPDSYRERIVNARLDFGNNKFNVNDAMPGQPVIKGNNVVMDVVFFDDTEIQQIYDGLLEGGKVIMPLGETYFSPNFGVLVDKFGIYWNVMQMHA